MNNPKRSVTPVSELRQSLEDPATRNDILCFVRDFPGDAQLVLPTLVKVLQGLGDATNQEHLAAALAAAGEPALPQLVDASRHGIPSVRRCAVSAMRKMGREARSAVPALIDRFTDDEPSVAREALEAIAAIGPDAKDAIPALVKCVQSGPARRRASAAYALEHIGPAAKDAVGALVSAVRDEKGTDDEASYSRYHCICALGTIGPDAKAAVPTLLALLKQDAGTGFGAEQSAALQALGRIGANSKEVLKAVTEYLANPNAMMRLTAAEALWDIDPGNQLAVDAVVKELNSHDRVVRGQAALALSEFGPRAKSALPQLRVMMSKEPDEDNRAFAGVAIEKITATPPRP